MKSVLDLAICFIILNFTFHRLDVFTQPLHHKQDVAQGQFFCKGMIVLIPSFSLLRLLAKVKLKILLFPVIYHQLQEENRRIHIFSTGVSMKWNINSCVEDLNSGHQFHFLWHLLHFWHFVFKATKYDIYIELWQKFWFENFCFSSWKKRLLKVGL